MKPLTPHNPMNKTEARYAQLLELLKRSGEILDYTFESLKFKLADKTYYTPDFLVVYPEHFEIHEVKGFWRDDARVKIKVAAEQFPWFRFKAVQWERGNWKCEHIGKV